MYVFGVFEKVNVSFVHKFLDVLWDVFRVSYPWLLDCSVHYLFIRLEIITAKKKTSNRSVCFRDKLATIKLSKYKDELLFYLFYTYVGDYMQIWAAAEL